MDFIQSIAIARELAGAARELQGYLGGGSDNRERQTLAPLVEALRSIYFQPVGLRLILTKLSEGLAPGHEDIERILPDFNDREWILERRLNRLDFDSTEIYRRLPLRVRNVLDGIAYGKRNLRREIQNELNESLTDNGAIDPARARELLNAVNELNSAIEAAEEALLSRME